MHTLLRAGLIKFLVLTIVCFLLFRSYFFTFYFLLFTFWFLLLCFLVLTFSFTQAATKRRDDDDAVTR